MQSESADALRRHRRDAEPLPAVFHPGDVPPPLHRRLDTPRRCRRFADHHSWQSCASWTSTPASLSWARIRRHLAVLESGRMSRATDWSAKRSTRLAMAFPGGAGNFALIPRAPARPPCWAVRGSRSTDPAGTAALGPVVLWEIAQFRAVLGRVRDTLCMSVVLSINASETGLAPERFQAFAGLFFQDAEMGCASFLSA